MALLLMAIVWPVAMAKALPDLFLAPLNANVVLQATDHGCGTKGTQQDDGNVMVWNAGSGVHREL